MAAWTLEFDGFDPATEGLREALCTLGNGYVATRGAAPEHDADGVHYPGTYAAGVYNRLRDTVTGEEIENESLVNLPNWLPVTFRAPDGPWLGRPGMELLAQRQELDLRRGVLTRRLRVRDDAGRTTAVAQRRFVHLRHRHVCGIQTTFSPEDWSGTLTVRAALDGGVENTGVARYRDLSGQHLTLLRAEPVGPESVLCVVETIQSGVRVAQVARTRVFRLGAPADATRTPLREGARVGHELVLDVTRGGQVTVEKLVTVHTSRDPAVADPATAAVERLAWIADFDELLAEQVLAWRQLWRRFHISLVGDGIAVGGGDNSDSDSDSSPALSALRLNLFHLLQTVSEHSADIDAGVPARGLHGEAYRGHVLWDELFVLPVLNLRMPLLSRALLRYRYRRLPWARAAARAEGRAGAMYPWQSGSDGREESQRLHLNPLSGRWVEDATQLQRHVGLAVAYNAWQYYQATGDVEFLSHYGAEMIVEVARFFASISEYDHSRDRYVIRGVMGPDEFHTAYPDATRPGIDNNAYTNVLAVWVLLRARDALAALPLDRRGELIETLGLASGEPERWDDISHRMYVPVQPDGVISQFEGYEQLAELDWDGYRARSGEPRRLDRALEAEGDTPNRYQASKQADVLMLFYLLSADELGELFARLGYPWGRETIPRNIEYYLARTSHGSTLSAVVHAWVLARNHRAQALEYFVEALGSDLVDIQGGTTAEGIHLAAMAGSVDLLQRCFAGVETRGDTLWLNPYWPPHLGTLELDLHYRDQALTLHVTGETVRVAAAAGRGQAVRLCCRGELTLLTPGQVVEFPTAAGPRPITRR